MGAEGRGGTGEGRGAAEVAQRDSWLGLRAASPPPHTHTGQEKAEGWWPTSHARCQGGARTSTGSACVCVCVCVGAGLRACRPSGSSRPRPPTCMLGMMRARPIPLKAQIIMPCQGIGRCHAGRGVGGGGPAQEGWHSLTPPAGTGMIGGVRVAVQATARVSWAEEEAAGLGTPPPAFNTPLQYPCRGAAALACTSPCLAPLPPPAPAPAPAPPPPTQTHRHTPWLRPRTRPAALPCLLHGVAEGEGGAEAAPHRAADGDNCDAVVQVAGDAAEGAGQRLHDRARERDHAELVRAGTEGAAERARQRGHDLLVHPVGWGWVGGRVGG